MLQETPVEVACKGKVDIYMSSNRFWHALVERMRGHLETRTSELRYYRAKAALAEHQLSRLRASVPSTATLPNGVRASDPLALIPPSRAALAGPLSLARVEVTNAMQAREGRRLAELATEAGSGPVAALRHAQLVAMQERQRVAWLTDYAGELERELETLRHN